MFAENYVTVEGSSDDGDYDFGKPLILTGHMVILRKSAIPLTPNS